MEELIRKCGRGGCRLGVVSFTAFTRCCLSKGEISTNASSPILLDAKCSGRNNAIGHVSTSFPLIGWILSVEVSGYTYVFRMVVLLRFGHSARVDLHSFVSGVLFRCYVIGVT